MADGPGPVRGRVSKNFGMIEAGARSERGKNISNFNNLPVSTKGEMHFASIVLFKSSAASNDCLGLALGPA